MFRLLKFIAVALGVFACAATLLPFSKATHWFVRSCDFPRVQIAALSAIATACFRAFFFSGGKSDRLFFLSNLLCILWQCWKIHPFTFLARRQVKSSAAAHRPDRSLRLLIANVLMENDKPERLLTVIREANPDLVLTVETDEAWTEALAPLRDTYPHSLQQPQGNYYGLLLFSRFPLVNAKVRFLVQDDVPSVHTEVVLPSGDLIELHGLHPRPPEPIRDQGSAPRDAELVILGREIRANGDRPTIVAGDLNDVAWSPTTELFLRLSGLLDPRIGRGFFNSFHADNVLVRYPLDHVFHSNHFTLTELRRLPHIGSDHFPMLIELCFEPSARPRQPKPHPDAKDEDDADQKLHKQRVAARTGDDRPKSE